MRPKYALLSQKSSIKVSNRKKLEQTGYPQMFEIQQPISEKPMAFTRNDKEKYKIFDFLFFGAEKYTQLWDLSSLTRDCIQAPPVAAPGPDPWAPGAP